MRRSLTARAGGLLLHPTSLPNSYSIGDIGPAAHDFIDFLAAAGQHWWQMLPINPIGDGNSPYKSFSTFASNILLLSPDLLVREGWLSRPQKLLLQHSNKRRVDYSVAKSAKRQCLTWAYDKFESHSRSADREKFERFVFAARSWLPDYALFMALREAYEGRTWWTWDLDVRTRRPAALAAAEKALRREIRFHEFGQWQFARQWDALQSHAVRRDVGFIGDLPIFVSDDSADVWAHPDLFTLGPDGSPAFIAGVAPDYFSKTGQRWGNPHYRWAAMKTSGYRWWSDRLKTVLHYFDAVRIDHFIGFVRYYEIPAAAKTAEHGKYRPGPGADFFHHMLKTLGRERQGSLIAEDLGKVTAGVKKLRDQFGLPGMKVLQFAFGNDPEASAYQPHNYPRNSVVYTGTHDNNTTAGWFREEAGKKKAEKDLVLRYLHSNGRALHWDMIRTALSSVGNTAIIPVQDLLGLGSKSRMNYPGKAEGNWEWRLRQGALSPGLAERLRSMAETYQRI